VQSLTIVVRDSGPGIADLDSILAGTYISSTGLGIGIVGARRLMDRFEITSSPSGTTVTMRKILPVDGPARTAKQVQERIDERLQRPPASAIEEMQLQNQALIRAIDEARVREEEIDRINHELSETNTGVLALYDELDTLHRVSLLMGSQLDLRDLIQSIIDVTTELTNAEIGAFYFRVEEGGIWNLYASAGPRRELLAGAAETFASDFFGEDFAGAELVRILDIESSPVPPCASQFAQALADRMDVRAFLAVPLSAGNGELLGTMIFADAHAGRFTERSERIVGSIAAQAVVGIEKSRLFNAVKASNDAKDRFIAMLSHELRTPLNPVLAIVSSWHGDPRVPEGMREEVAVVARNIRLEARLIDDLLDFNKLINGKLEIDRSLVDLHGVIRTVVEICRADFEAKFQTFEVALEASRSTVAGDAARLQQVLWNVLKNAVKFTPNFGSISLSTSIHDEKFFRIVIQDNGIGIEPDLLTRIFGAFDQGRPQVLARFGGLGLGLAIARTFVERHGGTIVASSKGPGCGAAFTIDLPLSAALCFHPAQSSAAPSQGANTIPSRILLVEDHADTRETLTRLLTRKGHMITAAPTCAAARAAFQRESFDLIISDLGLPDCTGFALVADLHTIRNTPAIALSGYGMENDILKSKAAGFSEHLTKPIDFEQLVRTVDRLVSAPAH
jgi:signal transduction histidine kinase/CheY-like chemotaxis protein